MNQINLIFNLTYKIAENSPQFKVFSFKFITLLWQIKRLMYNKKKVVL